jgi:hypothetical protein
MTEARAALRRKYKVEILASKEKAWKDFITRDQPWRKPHKLNTKPRNRCDGIPPIGRTDGIEATNDKEASKIILIEKFPRSILSTPYQRQEEVAAEEIAGSITKEEITGILKGQSNRSCPGLDGINYKALKEMNKMHPTLLADMFNDCLKWSTFPDVWKTGKLVLLQKGKGLV